MNMINFYQKVNSVDDCPICMETLKNSHAVAHTGGGDHHPIHADCIKNWLCDIKQTTCPNCRVPVNKESLFSWKEKKIIQIKDNTKGFLRAARIGMLAVGASLVVLSNLEFALSNLEFAASKIITYSASSAISLMAGSTLEFLDNRDLSWGFSLGMTFAPLGTIFMNNKECTSIAGGLAIALLLESATGIGKLASRATESKRNIAIAAVVAGIALPVLYSMGLAGAGIGMGIGFGIFDELGWL